MNPKIFAQIEDLVKARHVTEVNGFEHHHFFTYNVLGRPKRHKSTKIGHIHHIPKKRKIEKKITREDFDAVLEEERLRNLKEDFITVNFREIEKKVISTRRKYDHDMQLTSALYDWRFAEEMIEFESPQGFLNIMARNHNKRMHSLNGNTFEGHYINGDAKVRKNTFTFSGLRTNKIFSVEEKEEEKYILKNYIIYTFFKTDTRIEYECKYITENAHFKTDSELYKDLSDTPSEIVIPFTVCRMMDRGETSMIVLDNGFEFELEREKIKTTKDSYILTVSAYIYKAIRSLYSDNLKLEGKNKIKVVEYQNLKKSTVWSNHKDYQPSKRCKIFFKNQVKKLFGSEDILEQLDGNSEGCYQFASILTLIPKNSLVFRFSNTNYTDDEVNSDLYGRVLASVTNQHMTKEQHAETAVILTQIQMSYIKMDTTYDCVFSLFYLLTSHNIQSLATNREATYSLNDIWEEIFKLRPLIQVFDIPLEQSIKIKPDLAKIAKFNVTLSSLKDLTEKYVEPIKNLSLDELVSMYNAGILQSLQNDIKPLRLHVPKIDQMINREDPELTEKEWFIKTLVENNISHVDLSEVFRHTIWIAKGKISDDLLREVIKTLARFRLDSMYQPGLNKMFKMKPIEMSEFELKPTRYATRNISFINEHLQDEKKIAAIMSSHYYTYSKVLGLRVTCNPFSTISYIFKLAKDRRQITRTVMDQFEEPRYFTVLNSRNYYDDSESEYDSTEEEQEEEKEGFIGRLSKPFKNMMSFGRKLYSGVDKLDNIEEFVSTKLDNVVDSFKKTGMGRVAESLANADYSSIRTSYKSIENIIKSWLNDFLGKICGLFGVEYDLDLEPYKLFTYYLLWVSTDCTTIKRYIVLTLAIELGIADFIWKIIKELYDAFMNLFRTQTVVAEISDDKFNEILTGIGVTTAKIREKNLSNVKQQKEKVMNLETDEKEVEGWMDYIWNILEKGTPKVIGTFAVILATVLGLTVAKGKSRDNIGETIINGARNVSFIAMGLTAMPKIFSYVLSSINWVIDEVKAKICKKHETKTAYIERVSNWLSKTLYAKGLTEMKLVRSAAACNEFFANYIEMQQLQEKHHLLCQDSYLRAEFSKRVTLMTELFPVAQSASIILYGQHEVFHVQFTSGPGYGKTDLSDQVMTMLQEELRGLEEETAKAAGVKKTNFSSGLYPLNDTLKHNDMYFAQNFGYLDEDKVFKNSEPDAIVSKMMMLSGFPCISQQASLTDKGRMFQIRVLVSNTNNPYTNIDNLINKDALHRRRQLFRVRLKEEYSKTENGKKTVDDEKILNAGINRSKGEHLVIDWMDPLRDTVLQDCKGMSVKQALKLISALMKKHYQIEEQRLYSKDPMKCFTRIAFENLMQDLIAQDIGIKKEDLKYSARALMTIQSKIDEAKISQEKKNNIKREVSVYENIIEHIGEENDIVNEFNPTEQMSFYGPYIEDVEYALKVIMIQGKSYYVLGPGKGKAREGKVDFKKFSLKKFETGGRPYSMVHYERGHNDDTSAILYYINKFSGCLSESDFKKELNIAQALEEKKGFFKIWKMKLMNVHNRTMRAIKSAATFLTSMAIKLIGEPIFKGILLGFSIFSMFVTLQVIGRLLAPQTVTVSNPPGVKPMFVMPPAPAVRTRQVFSETRLDLSDEAHLIKGATYKIQFAHKGLLRQGTMIGIKGSIFMSCAHTFAGVTTPTQIQIYDNKFESNPQFAVKEYTLLPRNIKKLDNKDIVLLYIEGFRSVRTIEKHFVTEYDLGQNMDSFTSGYCVGIMLRNKDFQKPKQAQWLSTGYCPYHITRDYNKTDPTHDRVITFKSDVEVKPGDSGSLVMHDNPKIQNKFIGLIFAVDYEVHVAVVSQENIEQGLRSFETHMKMTTTVHSSTPLSENHELYKVFKYPDEVYNGPYGNLGISQSPGFRKTYLNGKFEDSLKYEVQPAIQNLNDRRMPPGSRNPFYVSLNKTAGEIDPSFTDEESKFMMKGLENMFIRYTKFIETYRTLNTREAIVGIPYRGSTPINTKTTPGLPYKLYTTKKGKSQFINFYKDTQTWGIDNIVLNDVESMENQYIGGFVPRNEKLEFTKKELVKEEKIINPKTRTVATGNMIHQIVYNKLFKHLYILFKNSWDYGLATPIALGVDPVRHWDQVAEHLKYHDYMIDFDVKAWEEKVNLRLLGMNTQVKLKLLERAYKSRGEKFDRNNIPIAHGLVVDYTDTYVCFRDLMYRKRSGLLSGHPGTLMENSEIHTMIMYLICFRVLKRTKPAYATEGFIAEHIRFILAADDIVIAISQVARLFITFEDIVKEYGQLGFEITAADKSKNLKAKTINEIQFLKQSFNYIEGRFYPKPNWDIIYQLLSWVREDSVLTEQEQTRINRENAFSFLWWRGEEDYEKLRSEFNQLMLSQNFQWTYDYSAMAKIIEQRQVEKEESSNTPNAMEDEMPFVGDEFFES